MDYYQQPFSYYPLPQPQPEVDHRQQGQFFPGPPGPPGGAGGVNQRLIRLERQMESLNRRIDQLDRRVDRIERRLGLRQEGY